MRRRDYEGAFLEILRCDPAAVDASRIDAGASFLDSHRSNGMANRLGSIVRGSLRFEPGKAVATILLSRTAEADRILSDLQDGVAVPISVGYQIETIERSDGDDDSLPTVTVMRWHPTRFPPCQFRPIIIHPPVAKTRMRIPPCPKPNPNARTSMHLRPHHPPGSRHAQCRDCEPVPQLHFRRSA